MRTLTIALCLLVALLRRGFLVPPNGLRGSDCGAAFAALSCGRDRVRWRSRWLLLAHRPGLEFPCRVRNLFWNLIWISPYHPSLGFKE